MSNRRTRKRMDGITEEVTKSVELSKMVQPSFLTLTKLPANQVGFKIVRDDNGDTTMSQQTPAEPTRRRRLRSTQRSTLLFIEFPEGATDDDVKATAEEYGLEGYEVTETSDGRKCLKRNDLTEIPQSAITVTTGDGKRLGVTRAEKPAATDSVLPYVSVVAIEFDKEVFADEVATGEYLQRHDIDFLENGVENTDKLIRVIRSEFNPSEEIRRVEVETGVVAVVTRAATEDDALAPSKFTEVVCEECYGQWGWGQLDFNAMMADVQFCEAVDDATYRLRSLIERILFWSELPVSARKELVNRATTQFSEYVGALLDGLPAKVILVNRSDSKENTIVSNTKTETQAAPSAENTPVAEAPITRAELTTLIADGIAAALAPKATEAAPQPVEGTTQRSEEQGAPSATDPVLEAVKAVADSVKTLTTSVEAVTQRMDKVEGAAVVRSDSPDPAQTEKCKDDVFVGIFGRR